MLFSRQNDSFRNLFLQTETGKDYFLIQASYEAVSLTLKEWLLHTNSNTSLNKKDLHEKTAWGIISEQRAKPRSNLPIERTFKKMTGDEIETVIQNQFFNWGTCPQLWDKTIPRREITKMLVYKALDINYEPPHRPAPQQAIAPMAE